MKNGLIDVGSYIDVMKVLNLHISIFIRSFYSV